MIELDEGSVVRSAGSATQTKRHTLQVPGPCSYLQDLGQLLAGPELSGGLVDVLIGHFDLLRLLRQGGLKVEAPQARLVLWHHQHLEDTVKPVEKVRPSYSVFPFAVLV